MSDLDTILEKLTDRVKDNERSIGDLQTLESTPVGEAALTSAYYRADESLHVPGQIYSGEGGSAAGALKLRRSEFAANHYMALNVNTAGGRLDFDWLEDGVGIVTRIMTLKSDGRVGIGTASPVADFHVRSSAGSGNPIIYGETSGGNIVFEIREWGTDEGALRGFNSAGTETVRIQFQSGGKAYFNTGGKVGIGTTSPGVRLEVVDTGNSLQARFGDVGTAGLSPSIRLTGELSGGANRHVDIHLDTSNDVFSLYAPSSVAPSIQALNIDTNGRVGIGTTGPGSLLDVNGTSNFTDDMRIAANRIGYIAVFTNDGNDPNRNVLWLAGGQDTNPSNRFINFADGNSTNVGSVDGDGAGGVDFNTTSDKRAKEAIEALGVDTLDKILALQPVTYRGLGAGPEGRRVPGLLAQDVREIFPSVVTEDEDGLLSISYGKLVPLMVRALQTQQQRIEALEAQLA